MPERLPPGAWLTRDTGALSSTLLVHTCTGETGGAEREEREEMS